MSSRMNKCNRGEDLVTYLYGEATSQDALAFESHLVSCEMCREELSAFGPLRQQLKDWQIESSPRIEVSIQRSPFEVLRELVSATPGWVKLAGLAAASAAVILVSLTFAGTRISWREGTVSFGMSEGVGQRVPDATTSRQLARAEIDSMIDARVKAVRLEESRRVDEMSAQVVNLNQQLLQASQTQAKLIQSLATVRKEQRTLLARSQSTLGEWLFASNGTAEQMDESNDRKN